MGKKAPDAPDYASAAKEQGAASAALVDKQTAANRPDIYTPWGSQTWTQDATNKDKWTMNLNLSPDQQAALNDQQKIQAGRSQGALQLLDQATSSFQKPINYDALPQGGQSVNPFSFGSVEGSLGPRAQLPTSVDYKDIQAPSVSVQSASSGPLKYQMDHTAGEWRQKGQDAALAFQQPLIDRRRSQLENQLANMGLTRGSEAWNSEMQRDSDQAMRDQLQAFGAGQNEAKMLFDQDLQGSQFTNNARNQEFQQNAFNAQQANQAALAQAQMGLQSQLANNQFKFQNADFGLRSEAQGFGQDLAAANFNNQAQAQKFNQGITAGNYNQNLRQAALAEATARRSQPLNELNALLTGQQVSNPNMPSFNTAGRGETPQLLSAMNMGYQADLNSANANNGALMNLGQMGLSAFMFSDARLKEDIEYTGDSIGGVPVVHYRYRGLPGLRTGVIAQDVLRIKPQAVVLDPSGYLKVNYSELCA